MSWLTAIGAALGLVPKLIDAFGGIAKATRKGKPVGRIPFGREHHWVAEYDVFGKAITTRYCVYCRTNRTDYNSHAECPGP